MQWSSLIAFRAVTPKDHSIQNSLWSAPHHSHPATDW